MTNYNGWSNYATWRINLELISGLEKDDLMLPTPYSVYDLANYLKEYAQDAVAASAGDPERGECLAFNYALAFLSEVNWYEIAKHKMDD
jgi:hypothetical protein